MPSKTDQGKDMAPGVKRQKQRHPLATPTAQAAKTSAITSGLSAKHRKPSAMAPPPLATQSSTMSTSSAVAKPKDMANVEGELLSNRAKAVKLESKMKRVNMARGTDMKENAVLQVQLKWMREMQKNMVDVNAKKLSEAMSALSLPRRLVIELTSRLKKQTGESARDAHAIDRSTNSYRRTLATVQTTAVNETRRIEQGRVVNNGQHSSRMSATTTATRKDMAKANEEREVLKKAIADAQSLKMNTVVLEAKHGQLLALSNVIGNE